MPRSKNRKTPDRIATGHFFKRHCFNFVFPRLNSTVFEWYCESNSSLAPLVALIKFSFYCEAKRAKRAERSTFATLCVIFLTMEYENQGLQNRPLLCLNSIHNTVTVPLLSKFHSLKLHLYSENFRGRPAYKCLGKKALEA